MKAVVRYDGDVLASVMTNHPMSIEDILNTAGLNIEDYVDEEHHYDRLSLTMEQD